MSQIGRKEELEKDDDVQGFDYRTHVQSKKDRNKIKIQTYRMEYKAGAAKGEVHTRLERPIGSGKFYSEDGVEIKKESE